MDSISKLDVDKTWGKILKDYRIKYGLTQEEMAEKVGISVKYISRIETGKGGIKTQTLIKYMNVLGITPNTLYKQFIENPDVLSSISLSEKIDTLTPDKKLFVYNVIDELKNIK